MPFNFVLFYSTIIGTLFFGFTNSLLVTSYLNMYFRQSRLSLNIFSNILMYKFFGFKFLFGTLLSLFALEYLENKEYFFHLLQEISNSSSVIASILNWIWNNSVFNFICGIHQTLSNYFSSAGFLQSMHNINSFLENTTETIVEKVGQHKSYLNLKKTFDIIELYYNQFLKYKQTNSNNYNNYNNLLQNNQQTINVNNLFSKQESEQLKNMLGQMFQN